MSSQSEYAGTAAQGNFGSGTTSWSNLAYAEGSPVGGDYASNDVLHSSSISKSLDLYNFNFSIPSGATNGVTFSFEAYQSPSNSSLTLLETWVEVGGTQGNFTANGLAGSTLTTSAATYNTGSSTDLCGLSSELTVANCNSDVENTGITIGIAFKNTSGAISTDVYVQACQCTVYYTAASGGLFRPCPMNGLGAGGPFFANPIG